MADFRFRGNIPGSKSIFNRALIIQSYFSDFHLLGFSECDDVRHMRESLLNLFTHGRIHCGEGGTTFRFMALRASRNEGSHFLEAFPRLLERPQKGLLELLRQLGVQAQLQPSGLLCVSEGWKKPANPIRVDTTESSQYASALVLNSWLLDFDLEFELVGDRVSESYFELTLKMLAELGMTIRKTQSGYVIPAGQVLKIKEYTVEADLSSAFTIAAAGALAGEAIIENFPFESEQPDKAFLQIFKRMGIEVSQQGSVLKTHAPEKLYAVECDLFHAPDLFPVLAVLCSWAHGVSRLYNAPQLVKKESNRIQKVADLLNLVGVQHQVLADGMIIYGNPEQKTIVSGNFNPDKDHRMVMAATLMRLKGHRFKIEEPQVINKSFPEYWEMIGLQP